LNKHFRFPNEAFTGKQVPRTRILKHAYGSVAKTFDDGIEDDDANMPSSSHDDTSSDLRRSQPSMKVVHQATIMWSAASKFYLLMSQTYQK